MLEPDAHHEGLVYGIGGFFIWLMGLVLRYLDVINNVMHFFILLFTLWASILYWRRMRQK